MRITAFLPALLLASFTATASLAADWKLDIKQPNGPALLSGAVPDQAGKLAVASGRVLSVTCAPPADCTTVTAIQSDAGNVVPLTPVRPTTTAVQFSLRHDLAANTAANLKVLHGGTQVFQAPLQAAAVGASESAASGQGTLGTGTTTLTKLLSTPCAQRSFAITPYDAPADRAEVVITARGNIISGQPSGFDEDDTLKVTVYGDDRLLPLLKVQRKSAFRVVGGINILGADVQVPATLIQQAEGAEPVPSCTTATFELSNFAPGRGEVEISIMSGMDALVVGGFEFSVHPLYTGMFTLGGLWTQLVDPGFEVATRDGASVIVRTESGDRRFAYSFLYTPFLWGKRDIEKGPDHWYHRINPSLGFVLDDPLDNLLVGGSVDIASSIVVTVGAIFSHVEKLDGVAVGDVFTGTTADLPITNVWRHEAFVGASLDLRAAVALIGKVVSP